MKKTTILLLVLLGGMVFTIGSPVFAGFGDFLKSVEKVLGGGDLSEEKIVQGLKEALEIGTKNAVGNVSQTDGYYKNPLIRILLPEEVKKVEGLLRTVGYGSQLDSFELSMNRAAERAAPRAKEMFWETIRGMNFDDARKILKGRENEATLYFKEKTWGRLSDAFKPIVHETMSTVGVTRRYQELESRVTSLPFGDKFGLDLDKYVTDGALQGLFSMLAEEEKKIRENPAARVTDLLKEVFGKTN